MSPAIDPRTGERELPNFDDAHELLSDTCTDSGVAALKDELLMRFAEDLPQTMMATLQTSAAAWDGISGQRSEVFATYSDSTLEPLGTSLHFCQHATQLSGPSYREAQRIAREIKSKQPKRVVLVGHTDHHGTCRRNDSLGLRRADFVKHVLASAGIPLATIRTATLGERRPLNFSSNAEAQQLNRRVEILLEASETREDLDEPSDAALLAEVERIVPNCGEP
jgi:outer membrane protein OmpA-like peptidoglycan-associated protein